MFQKCFVLRVHAVHLINASRYVDITLGIAKTLVAPKVMKRVGYRCVSCYFENIVEKKKNKSIRSVFCLFYFHI